MALILCPGCDNVISEPSDRCPNCGHRFASEKISEKTSVNQNSNSKSHPVDVWLHTATAQSKESCANCGRTFGKLEEPTFYKENIVCIACHNILTSSTSQVQPPTTLQLSRSDIKFICGMLGAALLALGVFLPMVKVPIFGSINYFRNGHGDGVIILILAAITLMCTLIKTYHILWLSALGSAGVMVYTYVNLNEVIEGAKSSVGHDLADNPFSDLSKTFVEAVQLEYGWIILAMGILFTLLAAGIQGECSGGVARVSETMEEAEEEANTPIENLEISKSPDKAMKVVFTIVFALFFTFLIFYAWFMSRKH